MTLPSSDIDVVDLPEVDDTAQTATATPEDVVSEIMTKYGATDECGSEIFNLFKTAAVPVIRHIVQQFNGTELAALCDPSIEKCTTAADMHRYEEYEEYNRFLGLVAAVAGIAPTFLFFYPMYFGKTSA